MSGETVKKLETSVEGNWMMSVGVSSWGCNLSFKNKHKLPGVKDVFDMHDYYKFTLMNLRAY